jgi:hypothetical protein
MSGTELSLGVIPGRGCASRRFADALLRTLGATTVTIRVSDASTGDTGSQLGQEPPPAEDLQIYPAMLLALPPAADCSKRMEIMISATTLAPIAKSHNVTDVATWLLTAQGIVHHDQLMHIDTVIADRALGSVCLYRITATE